MMFSQKLNTHIIFKQQAKALIRLRVCAGWSEALLVPHTWLLEISCTGSFHSLLKLIPQKTQAYDLFPVCIIWTCAQAYEPLKWCFLRNWFPQISHLNGLAPVWIILYEFIFDCSIEIRSVRFISSMYYLGMCTSIWASKWCFLRNWFPQISHLCVFIFDCSTEITIIWFISSMYYLFMCTSIWASKWCFLRNWFPQISHLYVFIFDCSTEITIIWFISSMYYLFMCTSIWASKWCFLRNWFPQIVHLNGTAPVWSTLYAFVFESLLKLLQQKSQA